MSDPSWDFAGHEQILVNLCLMIDCYLQPWMLISFEHVHKQKEL